MLWLNDVFNRLKQLNIMNNCETRCKSFTGGEVYHHRNCQYYHDSMSQLLDNYKDKDENIVLADVVCHQKQLLVFAKFLLDRSYVRGKYYPKTLVKLFKDK